MDIIESISSIIAVRNDIKPGDKYYSFETETIDILEENELSMSYDRKVIATQDQLPNEYIQQFVEEYNKGEVKDVEIEMTTTTYDDWMENGTSPVYPKPKLTMGFITIINKEPILYTEEEVKEFCYKAMRYKGYTEYNECMEWFETNIKK